jgi:hypothetical protein
MINIITGKVPSVTGKINGNTPEERVRKWRDHFSSLLGQPPIVENPDEVMEPIYGPLDINIISVCMEFVVVLSALV